MDPTNSKSARPNLVGADLLDRTGSTEASLPATRAGVLDSFNAELRPRSSVELSPHDLAVRGQIRSPGPGDRSDDAEAMS